MGPLNIKVEFGGGAELMFGGNKLHDLVLPEKDKWTVEDLLIWIKDNILQERPELFLQNETIRPGILILINDTDWELMDTVHYELQQNDKVIFISTLHGG